MPRRPGAGRVAKPRNGIPRYNVAVIPKHLFGKPELLARSGVSDGIFRSIQITAGVTPVAMTTSGRKLYSDASVQELIERVKEKEAESAKNTASFDDDVYTKKDALDVFRDLRRGKNPVDIAIDNDIDPRNVELIQERYFKTSGDIMLDTATVEKIRKLFPTVRVKVADDVLSLLRDAVRVLDKTCARCRKNERSSECETCVVAGAVRRATEAMERAKKKGEPGESGEIPKPGSSERGPARTQEGALGDPSPDHEDSREPAKLAGDDVAEPEEREQDRGDDGHGGHLNGKGPSVTTQP